uniref:reverse transcriptase/ribonuclease H family protein n=1 Tax=Klebsiella pneumoniae TaxID=573 RepID=UPI003EBE0B76
CKNAPATFQRLMNVITSELEGCVVYLDDIVIYSDNWDDHITRIKLFFEKISEAGLVINLVKSELGQAQVTYLGYVVGQGKVLPRMVKVQAINDFPSPDSKKVLMRFLGMAGYYRKFVPNFADVVYPLTNLLGKNVKFNWTPTCEKSFNKLKSILMNEPVLVAPNFNLPFKIAVDASDYGAGAVLLQDKDNLEHPVCYFSKKFNQYQRKYSTIEKELLSLILALHHFDAYISPMSSSLIVYTDHNPLTFLSKFKNENQRLLRWALFLQEYNLDIKHIKGKDNIIADALSRII